MRNPCTDHKGNEFNSESARAKYWGLRLDTVASRLNKGWSLKDALETPTGTRSSRYKCCYDHQGNQFESEAARARHWGIEDSIVNARLKNGWSLKDALESPLHSNIKNTGKVCYDHQGNKFESQLDRAKHWGIPVSTIKSRLAKGWTLKDALETPAKAKGPCKDHLGNEFSSEKERAAHWGVLEAAVQARLYNGWSLAKALETPLTPRAKRCKDHLNNEFDSELERAKYWNLSVYLIKSRLSMGWSLQEALETPKDSNKLLVDTIFFGVKATQELADGSKLRHDSNRNKALGSKEYFQYTLNQKIFKLRKKGKRDLAYIRLSYVSANFIAYYKVPWSNELKTSREVVQHYLADLLPLYDKENPSGVYRPMLGRVNPEYRKLERELIAGKVTLENLLKQFNCTIEQFNARIKEGASVDEAITGKKDVLILDI